MPITTINERVVKFVWEVPDSPTETYMPGQAKCTARVRVAYPDRNDFLDAIAGYSYEKIQGGKRIIKRVLPLQYPYHPGLYCIGSSRGEGRSAFGPVVPRVLAPLGVIAHIVMQQVEPDLKQPDYLDSILELVFSTLEYKPLPDNQVISETDGWIGLPDEGDALSRGIKRYITRTGVDAGTYRTLPLNMLYYKAFGLPIQNASATFYEHAEDLTYEWFDVPEVCLPRTAWAVCAGCVNDVLFDGYPRGTLLYRGKTYKRETDALGREIYRIKYNFRWLPRFWRGEQRGHNFQPTIGPKNLNTDPPTANPDSGKFVFLEVSTRGGTGTIGGVGAGNPIRPATPLNGDPLFPYADFRDLFRPEQP